MFLYHSNDRFYHDYQFNARIVSLLVEKKKRAPFEKYTLIFKKVEMTKPW